MHSSLHSLSVQGLPSSMAVVAQKSGDTLLAEDDSWPKLLQILNGKKMHHKIDITEYWLRFDVLYLMKHTRKYIVSKNQQQNSKRNTWYNVQLGSTPTNHAEWE